MSSPDVPAAKASRRAKPRNAVSNSGQAAKSLKKAAAGRVSRQAKPRLSAKTRARVRAPQSRVVDVVELTRQLDKGLAEGRLDILTPQALQALMAALCKIYAANLGAGQTFPVLADRSSVTSTDVMLVCCALLKSANLQVFELGMWQSWTGR